MMKLHNTDIQTTITVMGHIVHLEYYVTPEWAVEWWLNPGIYGEEAEYAHGIALLNVMLRSYAKTIQSDLLDEFESRQYEQEQAFVAQLADKDIPF